MVTGVFRELANSDYHGDKKTVNKGLLDVVSRSPLHAKAVLESANDNTPTAAQVIGTAFHTLVLEPHKFADEYVCELTREDAPQAIDDRDELVAMVEAINEDRLPKLPTGGTKAEQVERILGAWLEQGQPASMDRAVLDASKGADLKAELERLNRTRPGKLPTSGNRHELAAILREHGHEITLWSDIRARWDSENEGMTVLSVDTYNQLLAMRDMVMAHPGARALLTGCNGEAVAEASVYWTDEKTGETCRCRPDFWRADGIIVDLKTTRDASQEGFAKSLSQYRYHVQAPWYMDGLQAAFEAGHFPEGWAAPKAFVFLAVENTAPYAVATYVIDAESFEIGRQQYRADLDRLAECKRTGIWPGYGDSLQMIGVPQWYLTRNAHLVGG